MFFAIGALLVPINFVAAYALFYADDNADPTALWLAGSVTSAAFYIAVALNGLGRWYPIPAVIALVSAMGAFLNLIGAAPEAYPGSFIALAFVIECSFAVPARPTERDSRDSTAGAPRPPHRAARSPGCPDDGRRN